MSGHGRGPYPPKPEPIDPAKLGPTANMLLLVAALALVASLAGALVAREQFAFSWLLGFAYCFTLCFGALFWIIVHHAVDADWSVAVRRVLENVAAVLPYLALAFVPVVLCAPILLKWWTIAPGVDPLLDAKRPYLNIPFFYARAALYFVVLGGMALLFRRFSRKQDEDGLAKHTLAMRRVAFAGLPLFAGSVTFAAFDWLMGLDYKWFSTMWGVYLFAGAAGGSMSLLVLLVTWLRTKGYLHRVVTHEHYHIMGKLMLAFSVFWAYIAFSQYMLIWYSNIPEETSYFIRRNIGHWHTLSLILVIGRFFIPFPLLLLQATKKNPRAICGVAGWILAMQFLDLYLVVLPMLHERGPAPHWLDLTAPLGIAALAGWLFLKGLSKGSVFPARDPRLRESMTLTN
jgi:hypothetical protein